MLENGQGRIAAAFKRSRSNVATSSLATEGTASTGIPATMRRISAWNTSTTQLRIIHGVLSDHGWGDYTLSLPLSDEQIPLPQRPPS